MARRRTAAPPDAKRKTLTMAEAMDQTGLSRFILRGLIDDGELAMIRTRGAGPHGRILITAASLDAWLSRNAEYASLTRRAKTAPRVNTR